MTAHRGNDDVDEFEEEFGVEEAVWVGPVPVGELAIELGEVEPPLLLSEQTLFVQTQFPAPSTKQSPSVRQGRAGTFCPEVKLLYMITSSNDMSSTRPKCDEVLFIIIRFL